MEALKIHTHPRSNAQITGRRLEEGDVIEETDLYDCSDGTWRQIGHAHAGIKVRGIGDVTIIRQP